MAGTLLSTGIRFQSLPENYIRPKPERPRLAEVVSQQVPLIDDLGCSSNREETIRQIGDACRTFRCFQVIDHGISKETIEMVLEIGRELFQLPIEEKVKYYSEDPLKKIRLSTSFNVNKEKVNSWRDYLRLHCHPLEEFVHDWHSIPSSFNITIRQIGGACPTFRFFQVLYHLPVIVSHQVSLIDLAGSSNREETIRQIGDACRTFSFFQVLFHPPEGVSHRVSLTDLGSSNREETILQIGDVCPTFSCFHPPEVVSPQVSLVELSSSNREETVRQIGDACPPSSCFQDCDGSVLIDSTTNPAATAERDSPADNPSLRGLETTWNAKWWYSAFHNVIAMVGAGVLILPYAMSELGWGPGIAVLIMSWIVALYTLWQMVEMHEMVPEKRFRRYHELCQHALGEKLGLWIVVPQQLVVDVGTNIVYMVTGGKSLKKFHDLICMPNCKDIKTTYFIVIFGSVHFVLSQLPNFISIYGVSLATAAIMSLSYSTVARGAASGYKGKQPDVDYGYKAHSTAGTVFNFFGALGYVAFAYSGHNVVCEIQATIPTTPEKPSKKPMWTGVVVAYIIVAICYFPVALFGYWAFGNSVEDNILVSLQKPRWLIAIANMMVVIHVSRSYQIYAMHVFDMIETRVLVEKLHFPPGLPLRLISRTVYVGFTMFIAIAFPTFLGLLDFFGGFAFAPTTYFLPCITWLALYKPKKYSLSWIINWICIILGVLLMIISPIGVLRTIIIQAKTYKFSLG